MFAHLALAAPTRYVVGVWDESEPIVNATQHWHGSTGNSLILNFLAFPGPGTIPGTCDSAALFSAGQTFWTFYCMIHDIFR